MILTKDEILVLNRHIGYGPVTTAPIIFFGNEPGICGGGDLHQHIQKIQKKQRLNIGEGFSIIDIDPPQITSPFIQFIARLMLAIQYKDNRFFEELTTQGKIVLNDYIMDSLFKENSALINLRPLPRPTERTWDYDNINQKDYLKQCNYSNRHHQSTLRQEILKEAFSIAKNSIIIGSGDKENKRAFFKQIYPAINFEEYKDGIKIYFSSQPKIILSNYFDNKNGIRLAGLKQLYRFIINSTLL